MDVPTIIIDIGSNSLKAGLASSDAPDLIVPSVFPFGNHSFPLNSEIPQEVELDDLAVEGEIANNDRMTFLLVSIFDKYFPVDQNPPEKLRFIFTKTPDASISHLEFLAEQAFGVFGATEIIAKPQSVFSMLPFGFKTCLCIDIGHDVTQCSVMCDGAVLKNAEARSQLAGSALDLFTGRCILKLEDFVTYGEFSNVEQQKAERVKVSPTKEFDHNDMELLCGEILFDPSVIKAAALPYEDGEDTDIYDLSACPGIVEFIKQAIDKCDPKYHDELWSHVIVTGGSSMLSGLKERIQNELAQVNANAKCFFPENPLTSAWCGAAYCAKHEDPSNWLSFDVFDKDQSIVETKF